ncbi:GGDEF domain-containing phosphodiesterase [Methylophaga sp. SB9B]|uniref:sensor domain-containing protein n=1 Tax=Methylophaga sp. SB9B TaxID=2570356 RepID=UPI0014562D93|nr:GGDEF domain-containing phosphodiesterase [Methylophaga sp. SB9B]
MRNTLLENAFKFAHEGIVITDEHHKIVDINDAIQQITGYSRSDLIGSDPQILSAESQNKILNQTVWQSLQRNGFWHGEVSNKRKDGSHYVARLSVKRVNALGKVFYLGHLSDITADRKYRAILSDLVLNRNSHQILNKNRLENEFRRMSMIADNQNEKLVVAFMDLDEFKTINDIHGKAAADNLLDQVPARVRSVLSETDSIVRYGGDEFVLIIGGMKNHAAATEIIQKVLTAIGHPFVFNDVPMMVTASLGYTLYPEDSGSLDTLIRHADQSMYKAKLDGKSTVIAYDPGEEVQITERNQQLREIATAINEDQFVLFFQPKVTLSTGNIFGFEALIRWQHPQKGLLMPDKFIDQVYDTELEVSLGQWVICRALKQLAEWQQAGHNYQLSINLTAYHLSTSDFIDWLQQQIKRYPDLDTRRFQIEILESNRLSDLSLISNVVEFCKSEFGITTALDDFGTGYSSLTHIRVLPVDVVKVDQTFVRRMLTEPEDCKIVEGVIALAQSFNIQVIAEGVESIAHGEVLLAMGCNQAQGYALAKPLPGEQIKNFLANYEPFTQWCAQSDLLKNHKQARLSLFYFYLKHWMHQLQESLFAEPEIKTEWPITQIADSHCGIWLEKASYHHYFDNETIAKITQYHHYIFQSGNDLLASYLAGDVHASRAGYQAQVNTFESVLAELNSLIKRMTD